MPFWIFGAPAASTNHLAIRGLMYDLTHGAWEPWSFLQAKILFKKQGPQGDGQDLWWNSMKHVHLFPCRSVVPWDWSYLPIMGSGWFLWEVWANVPVPWIPMGILMFWCQLNINSIILVTYVYIIISSLRSAFLLESQFSENEWGIPQIVGKGKKKQPNTSFWEKKGGRSSDGISGQHR